MSFNQIFRTVPYTGVIYVMHRAIEQGYSPDDPEWVNLGQGAPETNSLPGSVVKRLTTIDIEQCQHEYSPVNGVTDLRKKVANFYNVLFRKNKSSQYTWENVSISGGGRVALTRIAAMLGNI